MEDKCLKCPGSIYVTESEIENEIKRVAESGVSLTCREKYEERLKSCNSCEQLVYGTTCMSCGCFVRVRAMNALRICPHASGSKW